MIKFKIYLLISITFYGFHRYIFSFLSEILSFYMNSNFKLASSFEPARRNYGFKCSKLDYFEA